MKRILFLISVSFLFIFAAVAVAMAASNGVAGDAITGFFERVFKMSPEMALGVYSAILTVVLIVLRVILKKIPGGVEGPIGKIIWKILAVIFGDGVRLEGSTDTAMLKEKLSEKYPLLKIDIKSPKPLK